MVSDHELMRPETAKTLDTMKKFNAAQVQGQGRGSYWPKQRRDHGLRRGPFLVRSFTAQRDGTVAVAFGSRGAYVNDSFAVGRSRDFTRPVGTSSVLCLVHTPSRNSHPS